MTFYVTRIKRKSKVFFQANRGLCTLRLLPVVGSGVLTDENALPETAQNFFFVFFSF